MTPDFNIVQIMTIKNESYSVFRPESFDYRVDELDTIESIKEVIANKVNAIRVVFFQ